MHHSVGTVLYFQLEGIRMWLAPRYSALLKVSTRSCCTTTIGRPFPEEKHQPKYKEHTTSALYDLGPYRMSLTMSISICVLVWNNCTMVIKEDYAVNTNLRNDCL